MPGIGTPNSTPQGGNTRCPRANPPRLGAVIEWEAILREVGDVKRRIRIAAVSASAASTLLVLLGLALTGCSSSSASTQSLTSADSGKTVTLDNGQQLTVELELQGGTGFSWEVVDSAGGVLEQQGEPTTKEIGNEPPTLVGQTMLEVFTFKAVKSGAGTLRLEYKRSWETTVPAEKTWTADVTVK